MVSTVRARPNHYEMLGLKPNASGAAIEQAFAREISLFRPRPLGDSAQLSLAYATLRDPAKRRAYDASLGLRREPKRQYAPMAWQVRANFVGTALAPKREPVSAPTPEARSSEPPERTPGAFIAASLREIAEAPSPEPQVLRQAVEEPKPAAAIPPSIARAQPAPDFDADERPMAWKRTGVMAAGLVAGVALLGAWAGLEAGNDAEQATPERAVTAALPPAKARPVRETAAPAPVRFVVAKRAPARAAPARTRRAPPVVAPDAAEDRLATVAEALQSAPAGVLAETAIAAVTAPAPVAAAAASLPLSNAVIARTIGRIGYSCGKVASTSALEGGAFKVTCTSGQSYRAAPVHGRYRFKRLSSH
jgi:hypothetical protein